MRLIVFLFFVIACSADVRVIIDSTGAYNITVNNQVWLRSSRVAIYADNRWYSTEDNSLPLAGITEAQGSDPYLGAWNETRITYNLVRTPTTTPVVAHIRQWSMGSAFTFHLETGNLSLTNQITLDYEQVRTAFPSFVIEKIDTNDQRGYFTFGGKVELFSDHSNFFQSSFFPRSNDGCQ